MSSTTKAKQLLAQLGAYVDVNSIKSQLCVDENEWYRVSAKAYQLHLQKARKKRKEGEKCSNVVKWFPLFGQTHGGAKVCSSANF